MVGSALHPVHGSDREETLHPPSDSPHTFRIGFTGTQAGMTLGQKVQLAEALDSLDKNKSYVFDHGCCIGADEDFHKLVRASLVNAKIIGHPSTILSKTSEFCLGDCDLLHNNAEPLKRNHIIVDNIDELWAAPKTLHEVVRSGTWSTIRYAHKLPVVVPVKLFFPDGVVELFT